MSTLPYFDILLEGRKTKSRGAEVFKRFVHWGHWDNPWRAKLDDAEYQKAMERLDDLVVGGAQLVDGMTIADVGCGFGGTLRRISERLPKTQLVGVNFDGRQLAHAEPSRAAFVRADACRLPLRDACCDGMLAVECIFHFPSRLAFLKEAARTLKPGARLSLSDFVPALVGGKSWALGRKLEAAVAEGYGSLGAGWVEGTYAEMARKVGLEVEVDRDITGGTLPTYLFLMKLAAAGGFGSSGEGKMFWPTVLLAGASATRLVRYRLIVLRKPR